MVHFKAAVSKLLNVTRFPVQILQNSGVSCAPFALKGRKTLWTASRSSRDILTESMETLYAGKTASGS